MKKIIFILLILLNGAILRLNRLELFPPVKDVQVLSSRYLTAFISLLVIFLVYKFSCKYFHSRKTGLVSSFVLSVLPWALEQNRIVSEVNTALFILLLLDVILRKLPKTHLKILTLTLAIPLFYIFYPQLWIFRNLTIISLSQATVNALSLFSPDMWFFHNITFYHGGLREWGFIYLTLIPFLAIGLYKSVINRKIFPVCILIVFGIITSFSPFFPESREFYLAVPFIASIIGRGFTLMKLPSSLLGRFITIMVVMILSYEMSELLHFYFVHYPLQVNESLDKINIPY